MEKNTTIKQTWYDFYKDKVNEEYYNYIISQYYTFIKEIKKELKNYYSVLEVGCGMGNITKSLLEYNKKCMYHILDLNGDMIKMAIEHIGNPMIFWLKLDIRNPMPLELYTEYNIIHSHGVLEHFEDHEIHEILHYQKAISPLLIHYVPSDKYTYKSFGDERLLSKEYWKENFNPTEIIEFNSGYDLILKWRR